jgi:anionic cell wall polymer biosynthesis LytR-Cps2A-Psr (LCP) family protein
MTKKLLALSLGLCAWIGGTVAASIGAGTAAASAQPLFVIEKAHADYTPALDGSEPIFILLMGSDSRPGEPMNRGRSDSIHILGINPAQHRATVFGIPRDSYVPLSTT